MKLKWNWGHLASQKFAGLIFCVFVCFAAGEFQVSEASTQAVVMGIVALYTAFVGGRTWSDNAALKFGAPAVDNKVVALAKKDPPKDEKKKDGKDEVD